VCFFPRLSSLTEYVDVLRHRFLDPFPQMFEHMPAIKHLFGLRGSSRCSFEVTGSAITANHLDPWLISEPLSKTLLIAAQEHSDGSMLLQIHQQGPCLMGTKRPIIDAKNPRRRSGCDSLATQEGAQGGGTDRCGMSHTLLCSSLSTQRPSACDEAIAPSVRATGRRLCQFWQPFRKNFPHASGMLTEKALKLHAQRQA
jgi:hypothetical protein